ncbi:glycosyltransferase [Pseudotenacibaculum sp. MALMAid0570]|mgnify:CR=1 FL=1|uniref:glycosyltransferase n=1 Tax=Pseudotenacibaculum sp. MALMAid0570 TaxID=3143938 RepID=UPI0032DE7602
MIFTVLFYFFVAVTVIQILYYISFFSFAFYSSKKKMEDITPDISIIVCAKNEEQNLQRLIPLLLKQKHPKFELVIINDASTDNTLDVLDAFKGKDSRIKIVNVENNEAFWGNKKYALTLGIKAAKYNHLLFTDADCVPSSDLWVQEMSAQFSSKKTIILGYGKYRSKRFSPVNLLVRYETLITAVQYFSYARLGSPYMAVGRNLAYTKDEFFKVKGFINHMQIRSGDDDLFIKDAADRNNTTISIHPNSFTISEAPKSFIEWFRQKRRHISTSSHYKFKHQFFLTLFFLTKLSFWVLAPFIVFWEPIEISLAIIGSYFIFNYITIGVSSKKLNETQVSYFLPFLELFLVLFQITIFIANTISKPTHWK